MDDAMSEDERAIRALVDDWMQASRAGDTARVLELMTEDVVFEVVGVEPFGRAQFAAASEGMKGVSVDGRAEILELKVLPGGWAFMRSRIDMAATPRGGQPIRRAGYTLTVLQKGEDGRWRIARDANLMTTVGP